MLITSGSALLVDGHSHTFNQVRACVETSKHAGTKHAGARLTIQATRIRRMPQARTYEHALVKAGLGPVAGVDEAGRGACCGPMAIAACILPAKPIHPLDKLTDSKKLSPTMREKLFPIIKDSAESWSVILISAADIDKYGIQAMNIAGMRRAVGALDERPHYVLTDAMRVDGLTQPHLPIIGGDSAARCIAAASVLAKVTRDHYMCDLAERYPGYGLEKHKGYGTAQHIDAVRLHGGTPEHRYTYRNVAEAVGAYRAHHSI